jgi:single-strand DNA-binding protein
MINNVILVGRLTKELDLRQTQNGKSYCNFTIACNRMKKEDGTQEADFINCITWGKTAENLCNYMSKGSLIGIEGNIQTRTYDDKDGNKRFVMDVNARNIQFLESKNQGQQTKQNNNFFTESPTIEINDDDLPF